MKQLRLERNLTQEELANKLSLSKSNISKYESNDVEPNIQTLLALSELFDVSLDYLIGGKVVSAQKDETREKNISNTLETKIDTLNEESKKELEQYIQFLKIKEEMDKGKDETSSTLEKNA